MQLNATNIEAILAEAQVSSKSWDLHKLSFPKVLSGDFKHTRENRFAKLQLWL